MIPLLMVLTIDGPLHEIHQEMVSNARRQGATQILALAHGPESPAEVSQRLRGVTVVSSPPERAKFYVPTLREAIVSAVIKPEKAFLALAFGMILIFAEFCLPGTVLPGALGGVIVMTALYGLSASNLRTSGILLLAFAACTFVASVYLRPHLLLASAAALAMFAGAVQLVDAAPEFRIRPRRAAEITVPFAIVTILLTGIANRARANKLPEQNNPVVFAAPDDILSTMSGESGKQNRNATAARRT